MKEEPLPEGVMQRWKEAGLCVMTIPVERLTSQLYDCERMVVTNGDLTSSGTYVFARRLFPDQ